jgi:hypothetical protein
MISPPTDSLYKFIAISGLVFIIWGASYPWTKSQELDLEVSSLISASDEVRIMREELSRQYELIKAEEVTPQNSDEINSRKHQVYLALLKAKKPIREKSSRLVQLKNSSRQYWFLGVCSIGLGLVLSSIGFYLWYSRVQRYLDRDLSKPKEDVDQSK